MCIVCVNARPCVCAEHQGYLGISVLAKEARGSIDRPPDRRGGSASESVTDEDASHIRYPVRLSRHFSRARESPRCVIDKRVHLLSRLIKFGTGVP